MGRLIASAQVTLDGVLDELEGWFEPGGAGAQDGLEQLRAADALLLGRETYEHLSRFWSGSTGPWADLINPIPKFVVSRTLTGPLDWNAELLGPDVAGEVAALKERLPGTLLSYGCGELAGFLAHRGLVDEVRLGLHPVVWGTGTRAFHAGELPLDLRLVSTTSYPDGVVRLTYAPRNA